jgi:hypothetical protein
MRGVFKGDYYKMLCKASCLLTGRDSSRFSKAGKCSRSKPYKPARRLTKVVAIAD